jgi:UDP-3-O-[3-hydroxymyristoyl] glucosamine N-acyltransferase
MGNEITANDSKGLSIAELAELVRGKIIGHYDEKRLITGTCSVDKYIEKSVSFVKNEKYGKRLADLKNAVVLIPEALVKLCERYPRNVYILVENVGDSLINIQDYFYKSWFIIAEQGVAATARVDKSAKLGRKVYIGENVHIGANTVISGGTKIMANCYIFDNVAIGNDTYIYPDIYVYRNSRIGNNCIIHSGVRIGIDGFRYEKDIERKTVKKILHVGGVMIGNRVEIGANSTIDRATFRNDFTIISDDVKIDDQVHIGHNVSVGPRSTLAAQTCVSGSARIGEDVWIGAGATISNGVTIGHRAIILLNAVVAYDIDEDEVVSGFYAMPHKRWKQVWEKLKGEL